MLLFSNTQLGMEDMQTNQDTQPPTPNWYFLREADFADLGKAADILTNGFFGENTNFFTLQIERLKTLLSLESTFPRNNMNQSTSKKITHYAHGRTSKQWPSDWIRRIR